MVGIDTSAGYQPDMGGAPADGSTPNANPAEPGGQPQGGQVPNANSVSSPTPNEPQPGQTPTGEQQTDKPKGDRLAALVNQRRDTRQETTDLRQQVASLQDSVSRLSPAAQQEAEAWQNPHDAVEAPMDHLRAEIEHLGGVVSQARQDVGQQLEQQQQQQALNEYERGLTIEIGTVAQQVPELAQAHQAIVDHFVRTAQMQGHSGVNVGNVARNALLSSYLQHAQAGTDAVTATVRMAQAIGFQAGGQDAPAGILGAAGGQHPGGQPAPNAPQQQIARGQMAAATSLGGATGNSGATSPPDMRTLTRMSRKELSANGGENLNRLKAMLRGEF